MKPPGENRIPQTCRLCIIPELQPIEGRASWRSVLGPEPPSQHTSPALSGAFILDGCSWPLMLRSRAQHGVSKQPCCHTLAARRFAQALRAAARLKILLARRCVLAGRRLEFGLERGESLEPRGRVEQARGPARLRVIPKAVGFSIRHCAAPSCGHLRRKLRAKPCSAAHAA